MAGRVAGVPGRLLDGPVNDSPLGSRAYTRAARGAAGTMVLRTIEVSRGQPTAQLTRPVRARAATQPAPPGIASSRPAHGAARSRRARRRASPRASKSAERPHPAPWQSGMRDLEGDGAFAKRFRAAQELGRILAEAPDADAGVQRVCSQRGAPSLVVALMLEADESNATRRMPILTCLAHLVRFVPPDELQDQRMWMLLQRMLFHSDLDTVSLALRAVDSMARHPDIVAHMCTASFARRLGQTVRSLAGSEASDISQVAAALSRTLDAYAAAERARADAAHAAAPMPMGLVRGAQNGTSLGWLPSFGRRRTEPIPASSSAASIRASPVPEAAPPPPIVLPVVLPVASAAAPGSGNASGRASPLGAAGRPGARPGAARTARAREAQIEELKQWRGMIEPRMEGPSRVGEQPSQEDGESQEMSKLVPFPESRRMLSELFSSRARRWSREMDAAPATAPAVADGVPEATAEKPSPSGPWGRQVASPASFDSLPPPRAGEPTAAARASLDGHDGHSATELVAAVAEAEEADLAWLSLPRTAASSHAPQSPLSIHPSSSLGVMQAASSSSFPLQSSAPVRRHSLGNDGSHVSEGGADPRLSDSDARRRLAGLCVEVAPSMESDAISVPAEAGGEEDGASPQSDVAADDADDAGAAGGQGRGLIPRGESSEGGDEFELDETPISPSTWIMSPVPVGGWRGADGMGGELACPPSSAGSAPPPPTLVPGKSHFGNTVNAVDSAEAIANTMALLQQASVQSAASTTQAQHGMSAADRRRARRNRFAEVPTAGDDPESASEMKQEVARLSEADRNDAHSQR
eukprot:scaffold13466_cov103-Isochrysis_galbana.AAC.3